MLCSSWTTCVGSQEYSPAVITPKYAFGLLAVTWTGWVLPTGPESIPPSLWPGCRGQLSVHGCGGGSSVQYVGFGR